MWQIDYFASYGWKTVTKFVRQDIVKGKGGSKIRLFVVKVCLVKVVGSQFTRFGLEDVVKLLIVMGLLATN